MVVDESSAGRLDDASSVGGGVVGSAFADCYALGHDENCEEYELAGASGHGILLAPAFIASTPAIVPIIL